MRPERDKAQPGRGRTAKKKVEGTVKAEDRRKGSRWSGRMVYQHISKISLPALPGETPAGPSAIITIRYDYAIIVTQPARRESKITPVN